VATQHALQVSRAAQVTPDGFYHTLSCDVCPALAALRLYEQSEQSEVACSSTDNGGDLWHNVVQ